METKLSKGRIVVGSIALLLLIGIIISQIIKSSKPVVLDTAYLNGDLLLADEFITDIVGKVELQNNVVICLCTTAKNKLVAAFLDKKENEYSCFYNTTLVNDIPENKYNYIAFTPIALFAANKDKTFYLGVYSNPQDDSITINEKAVPIQKINFTMGNKEYDLGFWATYLAKDTALQFQ